MLWLAPAMPRKMLPLPITKQHSTPSSWVCFTSLGDAGDGGGSRLQALGSPSGPFARNLQENPLVESSPGLFWLSIAFLL